LHATLERCRPTSATPRTPRQICATVATITGTIGKSWFVIRPHRRRAFHPATVVVAVSPGCEAPAELAKAGGMLPRFG
jgi:hypothetical protein